MRASLPPLSSAFSAPRAASPEAQRTPSPAGTSPPGTPTSPGPQEPPATAGPAWREDRLPVAGYLMNRRRRFGPMSEDDLALLLRAQDAVDRARAQVPHGRGNVWTDVVATAGKSVVRTRVVQHDLQLSGPAPAGVRPELWGLGGRAVNTGYMGAGQCTELTALVVSELALSLRPGQQAQVLSSGGANHTWPALQAGAAPGATQVVADAWAEGPAVLASDATWSSLTDRHVDLAIGPEDVPALLDAEMSQQLELLDARDPEELEDDQRRRMTAAGMEIDPPEFQPQPVLSNYALQEGRMMFDLSLPDRAHLARQRQAQGLTAPVRWAALGTVDELGTHAQAQAVEGIGAALGVPPLSGQAISADPLHPVRNGIAAYGVARALGAEIREAMALCAPIELTARQLRIAQRMPALTAPLAERQQMAQHLQQRVAELQAAAGEAHATT